MLRGSFLQSKIGRRIFCLFICCSIIPVSVLSILAFTQVMKNLEQQGHRRLHQSTKALGMSILERLFLLDNELQRTGAEYVNSSGQKIAPLEMGLNRVSFSPFNSIYLYRDGNSPVTILGKEIKYPPDYAALLNETRAGTRKTAIITQNLAPSEIRIFLIRSMEQPISGILLGEVNAEYLWSVGVEHSLPPMTNLCVFDQANGIIMNSLPNTAPLLSALKIARQNTTTREFEWGTKEDTYIANHFTLPLEARFVAPRWIVVLSQAKKDLFAPLDDFTSIFPGVVTLSLLVVAFLSMYYIRHTLVPLEKIKEGIQRVSSHNFDTNIAVQCNDEFQELARTFNNMAAQLGKQFKALNTKSEIDRAILSSLGTERIISSALTGIQGFLACDRISIILADPEEPQRGISYSSGNSTDHRDQTGIVFFSPAELMQLRSQKECLIIRTEEVVPEYLASINEVGTLFFIALPVFVKNRLSAVINMGYMNCQIPPEEDILHARQFADQMAVALSNSALIEELDQLNWGTLKALARTVDAKSSWTAGHSERVCEVAVRIGRALNLSESDLSVLHRAALLHDIGKVGIPNKILDKPGKLTTEEFDVIKTHPSKGARILEPIVAYKEAIPMVLQHHEKFDGTGYPNRLIGEDIHIGARILTVADVFDAMTANRPYRSGLELPDVLRYIESAAGSHFDPAVVKVFLTVLNSQEDLLRIFDEKFSANFQAIKA
jgi:putative nucleotidyltransferase with HDIG domain